MKALFAKFGPFLGLLLVIGLFSLSNEVRGYFLSYANFKIVLTQTVIVLSLIHISEPTRPY